MDGGRCESSLAERRSRGIDFGNSAADEDVGYVTRTGLSRAVREPKRSREETDPSRRKGPKGGVCKVDVRGDEFLFSSVRTSKASEGVTNSPAAVAQTRSRRRRNPWGLVLMAPRADNFERVNAGSRVIVFHHQTWMPVIGNWVNICHPKAVLMMIDGVHTRVRFVKRQENL
jgi:hypothetical protein